MDKHSPATNCDKVCEVLYNCCHCTCTYVCACMCICTMTGNTGCCQPQPQLFDMSTLLTRLPCCSSYQQAATHTPCSRHHLPCSQCHLPCFQHHLPCPATSTFLKSLPRMWCAIHTLFKQSSRSMSSLISRQHRDLCHSHIFQAVIQFYVKLDPPTEL